MEHVIVWGTCGTESSVAYLREHQTYHIRALVQPPSTSFDWWLKVLADLTNLANLFTCNLGKIPVVFHNGAHNCLKRSQFCIINNIVNDKGPNLLMQYTVYHVLHNLDGGDTGMG